MTPPGWREVDPFDLPDALGAGPVHWRAASPLGRALVHGELAIDGVAIPCDVLAVDEAYPRPVADGALRTAVHLAWWRGDLHLIEYAARLTLPMPGCTVGADEVLEAVARLARAVGADPAAYSVVLVAGGHGR